MERKVAKGREVRWVRKVSPVDRKVFRAKPECRASSVSKGRADRKRKPDRKETKATKAKADHKRMLDCKEIRVVREKSGNKVAKAKVVRKVYREVVARRDRKVLQDQ